MININFIKGNIRLVTQFQFPRSKCLYRITQLQKFNKYSLVLKLLKIIGFVCYSFALGH
jgi:hypothetical protein